MADEHIKPPPERLAGMPSSPEQRDAAQSLDIGLAPKSELERMCRWILGVFIILACGWGLLFFGWWVTRSAELGASVAGAISLVLFLLLEGRSFWLSRVMCL